MAFQNNSKRKTEKMQGNLQTNKQGKNNEDLSQRRMSGKGKLGSLKKNTKTQRNEKSLVSSLASKFDSLQHETSTSAKTSRRDRKQSDHDEKKSTVERGEVLKVQPAITPKNLRPLSIRTVINGCDKLDQVGCVSQNHRKISSSDVICEEKRQVKDIRSMFQKVEHKVGPLKDQNKRRTNNKVIRTTETTKGSSKTLTKNDAEQRFNELTQLRKSINSEINDLLEQYQLSIEDKSDLLEMKGDDDRLSPFEKYLKAVGQKHAVSKNRDKVDSKEKIVLDVDYANDLRVIDPVAEHMKAMSQKSTLPFVKKGSTRKKLDRYTKLKLDNNASQNTETDPIEDKEQETRELEIDFGEADDHYEIIESFYNSSQFTEIVLTEDKEQETRELDETIEAFYNATPIKETNPTEDKEQETRELDETIEAFYNATPIKETNPTEDKEQETRKLGLDFGEPDDHYEIVEAFNIEGMDTFQVTEVMLEKKEEKTETGNDGDRYFFVEENEIVEFEETRHIFDLVTINDYNKMICISANKINTDTKIEIVEDNVPSTKQTQLQKKSEDTSIKDDLITEHKDNEVFMNNESNDCTLSQSCISTKREDTGRINSKCYDSLSSNISRTNSARYSSFSTNSEENDTPQETTEEENFLRRGHNTIQVLLSDGRRDTILDDNGNIRIDQTFINNSNTISENPEVKITPKLGHIIKELYDTEHNYLKGLNKIIKIYKPAFKDEIHSNTIFGNIAVLFNKQKIFYRSLGKAGNDIFEVLTAFENNRSLFEQYPTYFKNHKAALEILPQYTKKIENLAIRNKEKLNMNSYLLTPIQRLGKYILLLENMKKELEPIEPNITSKLEHVLEMVRMFMSQGNKEVAIESILDYPSKLDFGQFLLREDFDVTMKRSKQQKTIFLFERNLIFTKRHNECPEKFTYDTHIALEDLYVRIDEAVKNIIVSKYKEHKKNPKNVILLEHPKKEILSLWQKEITKVLWEQLLMEKEKQKHKNPLDEIKTTNTNNKDDNEPRPPKDRYVVRSESFKKGQSVFYTQLPD